MLRILTQTIIVPTFVTKVTDYLCSGWFFCLQINFDFLTSYCWRDFFISFRKYCCPELKFGKIFYLWSFSVKFWGLKLPKFGTINARYISRNLRVSGDLIRHRNCSKLVEGSLLAIIDLLLVSKFITFVLNMACGGMIFTKNTKFKKKIIFFSLHLIFVFYNCSLDCSINWGILITCALTFE